MTDDYPPLQVVEWVDATNIATWEPLSDIEKWATGDGFLCRNVGYLVYEDDNCVVLAARFSPDGKATSIGLFERLPKGMIVARWNLPEWSVS